MQLIVSIFSKLAEIPKTLGIGTTIWAIAGLLLLSLAIKFVERADRILERFQKRWRKLSPGARWVLIAFALVMFGPTVWRAFPKGAGGIALVLGFLTFFVFGGLNHARRYQLTNTTPAKAWQHHLEVSRNARKLTKAVGNATSKPNGRARKPIKTPTGMASVIEPPDGMSAQEFADLANEGHLHSATARETGWSETKGMSASPLPDGTVLLNVTANEEDSTDPLAEPRWWKP